MIGTLQVLSEKGRQGVRLGEKLTLIGGQGVYVGLGGEGLEVCGQKAQNPNGAWLCPCFVQEPSLKREMQIRMLMECVCIEDS